VTVTVFCAVMPSAILLIGFMFACCGLIVIDGGTSNFARAAVVDPDIAS
jgi:hypothetical protein